MNKCQRSSKCKAIRYSFMKSKKSRGKIKKDFNNCSFYKKICIGKETEKMKVIITIEIKRIMDLNYKTVTHKQGLRLTIASNKFIHSKKGII